MIRCYIFREFDTRGADLLKPWTATNEVYLSFFLKDKPLHLINEHTGHVVKGSDIAVQGLATHYNGIMVFNGTYFILNIAFRPNGFYRLFQIPLYQLTNKILAEEFFSVPARRLFDQLQKADEIPQMTAFVDAFLLNFLAKQKLPKTPDGISAASDIMLKKAGLVNIAQLAHDANMSFRNFRRRFYEQVGVSPKLFCRIIRFNTALTSKLKNPRTDWSTIAHDCGYFDQMHLIKDFKEFAGFSPYNFVKKTPPPEEMYANGVKS